jgi:CRISPR type III-A-associated protein Csm2
MNGQERNPAQKRRGKDRPRQEGGQPPEKRPNKALDRFKKEIANKSFADEEIMRLSKELGESLVRSQRSQSRGDTREDTKTQVRKFYNLVRVIEKSAPETLKVKLRTLQAHIAYAVARKTVSEDFKEVFDVAIEKILKNKDDHNLQNSLYDFRKFFESFYAYFYYQIETEKGHQGGKRR